MKTLENYLKIRGGNILFGMMNNFENHSAPLYGCKLTEYIIRKEGHTSYFPGDPEPTINQPLHEIRMDGSSNVFIHDSCCLASRVSSSSRLCLLPKFACLSLCVLLVSVLFDFDVLLRVNAFVTFRGEFITSSSSISPSSRLGNLSS